MLQSILKKLLSLILLLLSFNAVAITYYTHIGADINGDGGYATPWNSLANINTATIGPADTVCIRGTHTGAGWTVPEAGTSGNLITYAFNCGDWGYGYIEASSGTAAVLENKGFTRVTGLAGVQCTNCPAVQINASDVYVDNNTVPGGDIGILLTSASVRSRVYIQDNNIQNVQGNGSSDGSAAGIYMLHTAATQFLWTDVEISGNYCRNNLQGCVNLKCDIAASDCKFVRLTLDGNEAIENDNVAFVIQDCYKSGAVTCADNTDYADEDTEDLVVTNNTAKRNTGGGFAIYGCKPSSSTWGKCNITGNVSSFNDGVIGGFDIFNSQNVTFSDNIAEGNTTSTIDGNAFLIDYGNKYVKAFRNECINNVGNTANENSGACFMVLKGEDVDIFSNYGRGNKQALFVSGGDAFPEVRIRFFNNNILDNSDQGVYNDSSQASSSLELYNNILKAPLCIESEANGAAQTENYNVLACTIRDNYDDANVVDWTDGANNLTELPDLISFYYPLNGSNVCGAGTYVANVGDMRGRLVDIFNPSIGSLDCNAEYRQTIGTRNN